MRLLDLITLVRSDELPPIGSVEDGTVAFVVEGPDGAGLYLASEGAWVSLARDRAVFVQSEPATVWVIPWDGRPATVTTLEGDVAVEGGSPVYNYAERTISVSFSAPMAGRAFIT